MLPLLLAIVVFAVLAVILLPLLRSRRTEPAAEGFDQAVYRDQLRELDRDLGRGVLTAAEAASARLEIQRRLLVAAATPPPAARSGTSPVMAGLVAVLIAGGSVMVYVQLGAPGVPDTPFASRRSDPPAARGIESLATLRRRLDADSSNAGLWLGYAKAAADLEQWGAAASALKRAIDLGQTGADTLTAHGEMLTLEAAGGIPPAARAAFAAALARDPTIEAARYYMALAVGQDGDHARSIAMLQALLADLPADAPSRIEIGKRIAEAAKAGGLPMPLLAPGKAAAPGPDAATIEAASQMPEADRQAMVRGMVDKLATRLAVETNDLDGWLRLGRAYMVLGEVAKAADAYGRAAALKPNDAGILQQEAQALLANQPPTAAVPPRAIAVLRQIEMLTPGQPAVLWYLGLVAAREGKPAEARGFWQRLLAGLPADGEDARGVKAAMDALRDR